MMNSEKQKHSGAVDRLAEMEEMLANSGSIANAYMHKKNLWAVVRGFATLVQYYKNKRINKADPKLGNKWTKLFVDIQLAKLRSPDEHLRISQNVPAALTYMIAMLDEVPKHQSNAGLVRLMQRSVQLCDDLCFLKFQRHKGHIATLWSVVSKVTSFETQIKILELLRLLLLKLDTDFVLGEVYSQLGSKSKIKALFAALKDTENDDDRFRSIARKILNYVNLAQGPNRLIQSFYCENITIGDKFEFQKYHHTKRFWFDINSKPNTLAFEGYFNSTSVRVTLRLKKLTRQENKLKIYFKPPAQISGTIGDPQIFDDIDFAVITLAQTVMATFVNTFKVTVEEKTHQQEQNEEEKLEFIKYLNLMRKPGTQTQNEEVKAAEFKMPSLDLYRQALSKCKKPYSKYDEQQKCQKIAPDAQTLKQSTKKTANRETCKDKFEKHNNETAFSFCKSQMKNSNNDGQLNFYDPLDVSIDQNNEGTMMPTSPKDQESNVKNISIPIQSNSLVTNLSSKSDLTGSQSDQSKLVLSFCQEMSKYLTQEMAELGKRALQHPDLTPLKKMPQFESRATEKTQNLNMNGIQNSQNLRHTQVSPQRQRTTQILPVVEHYFEPNPPLKRPQREQCEAAPPTASLEQNVEQSQQQEKKVNKKPKKFNRNVKFQSKQKLNDRIFDQLKSENPVNEIEIKRQANRKYLTKKQSFGKMEVIPDDPNHNNRFFKNSRESKIYFNSFQSAPNKGVRKQTKKTVKKKIVRVQPIKPFQAFENQCEDLTANQTQPSNEIVNKSNKRKPDALSTTEIVPPKKPFCLQTIYDDWCSDDEEVQTENYARFRSANNINKRMPDVLNATQTVPPKMPSYLQTIYDDWCSDDEEQPAENYKRFKSDRNSEKLQNLNENPENETLENRKLNLDEKNVSLSDFSATPSPVALNNFSSFLHSTTSDSEINMNINDSKQNNCLDVAAEQAAENGALRPFRRCKFKNRHYFEWSSDSGSDQQTPKKKRTRKRSRKPARVRSGSSSSHSR